MLECRIRTRKATATATAKASKKTRQRCGAPENQRRHSHVLAAAERDHRAEHSEPEEQDRGELVRPDERIVEYVARDHPSEQDQNLQRGQQRRNR